VVAALGGVGERSATPVPCRSWSQSGRGAGS
jgi:hypothetical protein